MYSSSQTANCAGFFAEEHPRYKCRCERQTLETSLDKGFLVKCRRARCSIECNGHWAYQHGTCLSKHLSELPVDEKLTIYRGHLRMPGKSTPAEHARAKEAFLQSLRRWRVKHGYTLELHGVLDITSPTEAHWDVVAYSNAPRKPLRAIVSQAWSRAGGLRQSLVELDQAELVGACKYQAKDTVRVDRRRRYVPAPQSSCGLNHHWSTSDFWRGRSVKSIWQELIAEWFPDDDETRESSNSSNTTLPSTPSPEMVYQAVKKLAEFRADIEFRLARLDDPDRVLSLVLQKLPRTADEAPTSRQIATQWGLTTGHLQSLLIRVKGLERVKGGDDWGWDDRWFYPDRDCFSSIQ